MTLRRELFSENCALEALRKVPYSVKKRKFRNKSDINRSDLDELRPSELSELLNLLEKSYLSVFDKNNEGYRRLKPITNGPKVFE